MSYYPSDPEDFKGPTFGLWFLLAAGVVCTVIWTYAVLEWVGWL